MVAATGDGAGPGRICGGGWARSGHVMVPPGAPYKRSHSVFKRGTGGVAPQGDGTSPGGEGPPAARSAVPWCASANARTFGVPPGGRAAGPGLLCPPSRAVPAVPGGGSREQRSLGGMWRTKPLPSSGTSARQGVCAIDRPRRRGEAWAPLAGPRASPCEPRLRLRLRLEARVSLELRHGCRDAKTAEVPACWVAASWGEAMGGWAARGCRAASSCGAAMQPKATLGVGVGSL